MEGEDDDELEYEVYYIKEEIDEVKALQRDDPFNDVLEDRDMVFAEVDGPKNLGRQNKFNILDYMPKPDVAEKEPETAKKKGPTAEQIEEIKRAERLAKIAEDERKKKEREEKEREEKIKRELQLKHQMEIKGEIDDLMKQLNDKKAA